MTTSDSFLHQVASAFADLSVDDLQRHVFVLPNHRSTMVFRQYLGRCVGKPMLSPTMLTIDNLFSELALHLPSPLRKTDNQSALFLLYRLYKKVSKNPSSFSDFVYWGKIMLADFNEIDVSMVNAKDVLVNIKDLHQIDREMSEMETSFREFWEVIVELYEGLRKQLMSTGLAYTGMLQREVVEHLRQIQTCDLLRAPIVMIGFNALSATEEQLFTYLKNECNADFYWDYASSLFVNNSSASLFLDRNTASFPSALLETKKATKPFDGEITTVAVPSDIGQTLMVSTLLEEHYGAAGREQETWAVVLADELMLMPLMSVIPEKVKTINITMGYPLQNSSVSVFLSVLFETLGHSIVRSGQRLLYHRPLIELLTHPFMLRQYKSDCVELKNNLIKNNIIYLPIKELDCLSMLTELFALLPAGQGEVVVSPGMIKALSRIVLSLPANNTDEQTQVLAFNRLLVRMGDLWQAFPEETADIPVQLFALMFSEMAESLTVPFEGEPLEGLQVMGVLETRTLSFDNLIVLSFNDDVFPKKSLSQSLIPYNVRRHFHMPTQERKDAISSYNVYRLLSHAKHTWLVYNNSTASQHAAEPSRFIMQLKYQFGLPLRALTAKTVLSPARPVLPPKKKEGELAERLKDYLSGSPNRHGRGLSASALNTYLKCPMWFCLQYVMGLRPDDQIEEELADNMFGTILHAVFEKLYQPFENREVSRTALEELMKTLDDKLPLIIEQIPEYKLLDVLARQAVRTYTERILRYDMAHTPFTYMGAEAELIRTIDIADDGDNDDHLLVREIQLYGKIDRIDKNDGQLRVVDYKSGKQRTDEPKGWDSLFSKSSYTLQTLFYCYLLRERKPAEDILPCLYFMPNIGGDLSFDPSLKLDKQTLVYGGDTETMFENLFKQCLREIADTGKMFEARPSSSNGYCTYCPFADICG